MTLFILEGPDRCGKSTEARRMMREERARPRVKIHFDAPPKTASGVYQSPMLLEEMRLVYKMAREHPGIDFVLDRGHVSWFVYESMLRGAAYDPKRLRDWERQFHGLEVVIVDCNHVPAAELAARDDGASTYTRATPAETIAAVEAEIAGFDLVMEDSIFQIRPASFTRKPAAEPKTLQELFG